MVVGTLLSSSSTCTKLCCKISFRTSIWRDDVSVISTDSRYSKICAKVRELEGNRTNSLQMCGLLLVDGCSTHNLLQGKRGTIKCLSALQLHFRMVRHASSRLIPLSHRKSGLFRIHSIEPPKKMAFKEGVNLESCGPATQHQASFEIRLFCQVSGMPLLWTILSQETRALSIFASPRVPRSNGSVRRRPCSFGRARSCCARHVGGERIGHGAPCGIASWRAALDQGGGRNAHCCCQGESGTSMHGVMCSPSKGKNWKKVAESFSQRTDVQCLHRWQKVLNPDLVKGPWTKEV